MTRVESYGPVVPEELRSALLLLVHARAGELPVSRLLRRGLAPQLAERLVGLRLAARCPAGVVLTDSGWSLAARLARPVGPMVDAAALDEVCGPALDRRGRPLSEPEPVDECEMSPSDRQLLGWVREALAEVDPVPAGVQVAARRAWVARRVWVGRRAGRRPAR